MSFCLSIKNKIMNRKFEEAIKLREQGLSIFPVTTDKKPAVHSWKEYQERYATPEEIGEWWGEDNDFGIALVTGKLSGVVVIDDDRPKHDVKGEFKAVPTVTSKTGSGGWHYFYKHPGYEVKNSAGQIEQYIDVRGDGGYVVLPPSRNQSGAYEWSVSPFDMDFSEYPIQRESEQSALNQTATMGDPAWLQALTGVSEGGRNNAAASLAGKLMKLFPSTEWEGSVWPVMEFVNTKNSPQLNHKELRRTYESVASRAIKDVSAAIEAKTTFKPESWETLSNQAFAPIDWLVDTLIPQPALVSLASKSGIGKTLTIQDLARDLSAGTRFLGKYQCKEVKVLLLDAESGKQEIHRRAKMLGYDDIPNKENFYHLTTYDLNLNTEEGIEILREFVAENNISVVIIDTLRPFSGCMDENDGAKVRQFMHPLMKMRDELNVTFIVLDHERKPSIGDSKRADQSQVVGSQDKIASVDVALALKSVDHNTRSLHQTKARRSPRIEESIYYKIDHHYLTGGVERIRLDFVDPKEVEETKLDAAKELVVTKLLEGGEYTRDGFVQVLKKQGVGKSNVELALKDLIDENLIDRYQKDGERAFTYRKLPTS
jgi:hypothetical protein